MAEKLATVVDPWDPDRRRLAALPRLELDHRHGCSGAHRPEQRLCVTTAHHQIGDLICTPFGIADAMLPRALLYDVRSFVCGEAKARLTGEGDTAPECDGARIETVQGCTSCSADRGANAVERVWPEGGLDTLDVGKLLVRAGDR